MTDNDVKTTVVIDNGTYTCRAGFAGDSNPSCIFSSVVGRPRLKSEANKKESYVGDEAQSRRDILTLKYPIEYGIVTNWDDMEQLWHHIFYNELRIAPEEHPVLLTEAPMNPKANREKMTQIMFETFNSPAMYADTQAVLSMYASGSKTGIVMESGGGQSHIIPIYEGYYLPHCVFKSFINGPDVTYLMMELLNKVGGNFTTRADMITVENIKKSLCYVAFDYKHETDTVTPSTINRSYQTTDGQFLTVGQERFKCPEAIFQPILARAEFPGVGDIIHNAIQRCDQTIRTQLYSNINLCGGNTLFPGLPERLRKEVESEAPPGTEVQVKSAPYGLLSPWVGGSRKASTSSFLTGVITTDLYDEYGPSIVHRMCF